MGCASNKQTETGKPDFVPDGELMKHAPELYEKLTGSYTATRANTDKFLQVSNEAEINEQTGDQLKI